MLPKFPEFKKLELSDKNDIEAITKKYPPYSDFNFVDMWSWDVADTLMVSELNGNLVSTPNDYFSDKLSYTFIGDKNVVDTVKRLFDFIKEFNLDQLQLKLVPEISLTGIDSREFYIEIDLNNYDYIYNLENLSVFPGNKFSDKRRKLNGFLRNHKNPVVKMLDIKNPITKKQVLDLNNSWSENKSKGDEYFYLHKEHLAIQRFLDAEFQDLICIGVFLEDRLIGYSIFSLIGHGYAMCHFSKADISCYGVYEYLMRESASILLGYKVQFLNYQEDLGLPGLRFFKNSFNPDHFLRKYFIKPL